MSRQDATTPTTTTTTTVATAKAVRLPDELEKEIAKYSVLPTIRGRDDGREFLAEKVGIKVTKYSVTAAVANRTLEHFLIADTLHFSERGLVRWALSQFRTAESA